MMIHQASDPAFRESLIEDLFRQLSGTWVLDRRLKSTNISEPTGNCYGTATFSPREPSVFINNDGKLELASAEMVYHEQGYFGMERTTSSIDNNFTFSRKYVWRLAHTNGSDLTISIWFTKPGTESIDYLFHKIDMTVHETSEEGASCAIRLNGDAGHLCVEDVYSSTYTFELYTGAKAQSSDTKQFIIKSWTVIHEVQGPKKDQLIETQFVRV